MRFITAFIKWWNGEPSTFKAPSTAANGVPRDRFAKVREHFDADGNYIFKDAGLARAAQTAKALGATMSVGFGTIINEQVTGTSVSAYVVAPTSGQPIIAIVTQATAGYNYFGTISDSFATPYTWTLVQPWEGYTGLVTGVFIGTGGSGPNGDVTVTTTTSCTVAVTAFACVGASTASGLAAIDVSGVGTSTGTTFTSVSLTPSAPGGGAVYVGIPADANSTGTVTGFPGGAGWSNSVQLYDASNYYGVSLYASPPAGAALSTSWDQNANGGTAYAASIALIVLAGFSAPSAPTLTAPANTATINALNSTTFSATYNSTDGQNQNAFAMRFSANSGAYTYWDVATQAMSASIVWNPSNVAPGNSFSVVLPANTLTNGDSYTWSFASQEAGANLQGAFAGDFALTAAAPLPSAPTLTAPANASTVDVAPGLTFSATYNPTDGGTQTSYAFRVKTSTGAYNYWNASTSALQSTTVWNAVSTAPGASWSLALPAGVLTDGNIYNWSFASGEAASGQQGPFATDFTLTSQAAPTVSVSAPSGSTTDAYPVVSWTAAMPSGATQIGYQVIIESGAFGLTPGAGTSVWNSGAVSSTATSVGEPVGLQSGVTYRVFVQVTETNNMASAWAYSTFTASFVPPAAPTFTAVAGTGPVTGAPMATLTIQANDNELTTAQASFETDTTGWAAGANTLLAASNAWAQDGAYSLAMTADAAGSVSASTPTGTSGVVCAPGQTVRAMASFHSPVTARAATVAVTFYDSTGAVISTDTSASVNSTLTGNGAQAFLTTTAPVNAATMSLTLAGGALVAPNATLSTALVSGTAYTSLAVTALTAAIAANAPVVVATAGSCQVFTASAAAAIGATSIAVTSLAANAAYPVGSTVDGEALYVDEVFVGPGSSTTWSPGGFVGSSTVNFTFSDDGTNWFAVRNGTGVAIPANQQVSVIDYEGALGFTRQYQAQVVAP